MNCSAASFGARMAGAAARARPARKPPARSRRATGSHPLRRVARDRMTSEITHHGTPSIFSLSVPKTPKLPAMNSGYAIQCSSMQPHPAPAKRLASLAPARADVDDRALPMRRAARSCARAPRVVENHDVGPPLLDQLDDGGGVKRRRGSQQRRGKRRVAAYGASRLKTKCMAASRPAPARGPRDRERAGVFAHAVGARDRHEQNSRRGAKPKAVNQRSNTNRYQARRNSGPTARCSTPRSIKRRTASLQHLRMPLAASDAPADQTRISADSNDPAAVAAPSSRRTSNLPRRRR